MLLFLNFAKMTDSHCFSEWCTETSVHGKDSQTQLQHSDFPVIHIVSQFRSECTNTSDGWKQSERKTRKNKTRNTSFRWNLSSCSGFIRNLKCEALCLSFRYFSNKNNISFIYSSCKLLFLIYLVLLCLTDDFHPLSVGVEDFQLLCLGNDASAADL